MGPEQVARVHEVQVEVCERQVRRLEDLLEELGVPTVPPVGAVAATTPVVPTAAPASSSSPMEASGKPSAEVEGRDGGARDSGAQDGPTWGQRFDARITTAEDRDRKKAGQDQIDRAREALDQGVEGLRRTVEANAVIVDQQRVQEQHELEAETVRQVQLQLGGGCR